MVSGSYSCSSQGCHGILTQNGRRLLNKLRLLLVLLLSKGLLFIQVNRKSSCSWHTKRVTNMSIGMANNACFDSHRQYHGVMVILDEITSCSCHDWKTRWLMLWYLLTWLVMLHDRSHICCSVKSITLNRLSMTRSLSQRLNRVTGVIMLVLPKKGSNFFKSSILRFRDTMISKSPKYGEKACKWKKDVVSTCSLQEWKSKSDDEVGWPVYQDGNTHGSRTRTLREQLSRDQPWNRSWDKNQSQCISPSKFIRHSMPRSRVCVVIGGIFWLWDRKTRDDDERRFGSKSSDVEEIWFARWLHRNQRSSMMEIKIPTGFSIRDTQEDEHDDKNKRMTWETRQTWQTRKGGYHESLRKITMMKNMDGHSCGKKMYLFTDFLLLFPRWDTLLSHGKTLMKVQD